MFERFLSRKNKAVNTVVPEFPPMVLVESTNRCNLSCSHCPRQYLVDDPDFVQGDIDYGLFKKIVDEVSMYEGTVLRPFSDGEPLLYPYIVEIVEYAKLKGVSCVWLNTSGILLNDEKIKGLVGSGIDKLEISIDAYSEDVYREIRRNDFFNDVVENAISAYQYKKKINSNTKVAVSIVDSEINHGEVKSFLRFWKGKVDQVIVRPYHTDPQNIIGDQRGIQGEDKRWPCPQLWRRLSVNFDGKVRFCVNDWKHMGVIGDANVDSLRDIWNGEAINVIRENLVSHNFDKVDLCRECHEWEHWTW
mgnify:CR=1 FL=1